MTVGGSSEKERKAIGVAFRRTGPIFSARPVPSKWRNRLQRDASKSWNHFLINTSTGLPMLALKCVVVHLSQELFVSCVTRGYPDETGNFLSPVNHLVHDLVCALWLQPFWKPLYWA